MNDLLRVLVVDDSPAEADLIVGLLEGAGWVVVATQVAGASAMRDALAGEPWDLVVVDGAAKGLAAPEALTLLRESGHDLPFIVVTEAAQGTIGSAAAGAGAPALLSKRELAGWGSAIALELREAQSRQAGRRAASALHSAQEQLHQAQKVESVGNLAAGVAHHFNNMLSVILGRSDLILAELARADPLFAEIEQIRSAGQSAADLTRQLLAFSEQQFLQPRVVDLNQLVAGVEKMLRKLIGEHIELVCLPGTDLAPIHVDPVQIEQVIMNLAINARDAMPDGGQLTLATENVALDGTYAATKVGVTPGSYVVLSLNDTGVGMTPATRARLFEPYFTTKANERGTGLGLCTALGIVRQSRGAISVSSEVGRGTIFKVYLPRAEREGLAPQISAPARSSDFRGTETILLVEDDERVRGVVRTILRKQGYTVFEASNAGEGLLICEQRAGDIDLLLTDVVMPRMSGRKLAERVSAIRSEIRVLYMSGYTDDFVFRQGVLQRGMAFLQKPIRPDMLAQKVREVLDAGGPRAS
jgi:two-component system, cell cycle sensor histidine kinase and response regulator CckA